MTVEKKTNNNRNRNRIRCNWRKSIILRSRVSISYQYNVIYAYSDNSFDEKRLRWGREGHSVFHLAGTNHLAFDIFALVHTTSSFNLTHTTLYLGNMWFSSVYPCPSSAYQYHSTDLCRSLKYFVSNRAENRYHRQRQMTTIIPKYCLSIRMRSEHKTYVFSNLKPVLHCIHFIYTMCMRKYVIEIILCCIVFGKMMWTERHTAPSETNPWYSDQF